MDNIIKPFITFAFLGWSAENIKNWNLPDFIPCNPIPKYYLSEKVCFVPFLPVYGFGGLFIAYMYQYKDTIPWYLRMIIYAIVFNGIELVGGYIGEEYVCNKITTCYVGNKLWQYEGMYTIDGYVDIEHTIYWMIGGLIGEQIYGYVKGVSNLKLLSLMLTVWVILSIYNLKKSHQTMEST